MIVLVSNVGSTSLKFKLFDMPAERVLCEAKVERVVSLTEAIFSYRNWKSFYRYLFEGMKEYRDKEADQTGCVLECTGTLIDQVVQRMCSLTE